MHTHQSDFKLNKQAALISLSVGGLMLVMKTAAYFIIPVSTIRSVGRGCARREAAVFLIVVRAIISLQYLSE